MNVNAAIPLASSVCYIALLLVILYHRRSGVSLRYAHFLAWLAVWSVSSFFLRAGVLPEYASIWAKALFFAAAGSSILYYDFVRSFANKKPDLGLGIGYALLLVLLALVALGYLPRSVTVDRGVLYMDRGPLAYPIALVFGGFMILSVVSLAKNYHALKDPQTKTRTLYLLVGVSCVLVFGLINLDDKLAAYSVDHVGNLLNAGVTTFAILRHRLLEIRFVLRRGLVYFATSFALVAFYTSLVLLLERWLPAEQSLTRAGAAGATALLGAAIIGPALTSLRRIVDRLFLGRNYIHRQRLVEFSKEADGVLDLDVVAQNLLQRVTRAVGANQVGLLLPRDGRFSTEFTFGLDDHEYHEAATSLTFDDDSAVVRLLAGEGEPLLRLVDVAPAFKALTPAEIGHLDAANCELLCPVMRGRELVGILSFTKKHDGKSYTVEDIDLLMKSAGDAAAAVKIADGYAEVRQQASTDELTGLFNHRLFYESIDEQTRRSCQSGTPFSLLMLDVDLFKPFNDTHGHLAGDVILREVADCLTNCIGHVDLAFRYGGEEFAAILPGATSEKAFKVAERIRKTVEAKTQSLNVWLTISVGMASWPRDAVLADDLVRGADAALYQAKRKGRNRTCVFVNPVGSAAAGIELRNGAGSTLSIVYALAATVDAKDHFTYGHSQKVSRYAMALGKALGLGEGRIAVLRNAGLLHDIGKIGISDAILRKTEKLTEDEFNQIKGHPETGVAILRHVDELAECLPIIMYHHERVDGSGYPLGLRAESIPLEARIMAIADGYDAMTSGRPYSQRLTSKEALDQLVLCSRTQFDAWLVEVFANIWATSLSLPEVVPVVPIPLERRRFTSDRRRGRQIQG